MAVAAIAAALLFLSCKQAARLKSGLLLGGTMNKAELKILNQSVLAVATDELQKLSEAQTEWLGAFRDEPDVLPPQETVEHLDRQQCCCMAALVLLEALDQLAPRNFTRENLLFLAAKLINSRYPRAVEKGAGPYILKAAAEILASIPTPEALKAGGIESNVHMLAKVISGLTKVPIMQKEEVAATAEVIVAKDHGKEVIVGVGLQAAFAPIAPRLTVFDLSVMQAAASIYASGTMTFSTNQLYRALIGTDAHTRITSKITLKAVKKSLDTLQATMITIDAERQAALGKYKAYAWNKSTFKGYMLPMTKLETAYYAGNTLTASCDCWRILDKPPVLEYAATIKQVATIPQEVKRLPEGVRPTVKNICLRDTLLYYICLNRDKGVKLKYSTLFKAAGVDTSNRDACYRMRKTVRKMLLYWQEIGFIVRQTGTLENSKSDTIYVS